MSIRGLAILVVEDEPLIAMDIIVTLEGCGALGLGPVRSLEGAEHFLGEARAVPQCDVVLLDYRLVDGTSDKLARRLVEAGVAVVLYTASSQAVKPLSDELGVPLVPKLASEDDLVTAIQTSAKERAAAGGPKTLAATHSAFG